MPQAHTVPSLVIGERVLRAGGDLLDCGQTGRRGARPAIGRRAVAELADAVIPKRAHAAVAVENQVVEHPPRRPIAVVIPVIETGDEASPFEPLPSWPSESSPQLFAVPSLKMATACPLPAEIATPT